VNNGMIQELEDKCLETVTTFIVQFCKALPTLPLIRALTNPLFRFTI